jgi:hypothetical protein
MPRQSAVAERVVVLERIVTVVAISYNASGREFRCDFELVVVEREARVVADGRVCHALIEVGPIVVVGFDRVSYQSACHCAILVHEHHHVGVGVERMHENRALVGVWSRALGNCVDDVRCAKRDSDLWVLKKLSETKLVYRNVLFIRQWS